MAGFAQSEEYASLVARFTSRGGYITPPEETALLYGIIQRVRPQLSLEIGTFFASTTRIMADAIVEGQIAGTVVTLDPFGQERAPRILQSWPEATRAVTDYRPWSSMHYFLDLENLGTPKGAESPLRVVFVDGHHNFEYALYDIIRSADHVAPGGAILIDNLEQEGPKTAVIEFLRWNPAWRLFYKGGLLSGNSIGRSTFIEDYDDQLLWGVLLAPTGIQVSTHPIKLVKRCIPYVPVHELRFNLRYLSHPGVLQVTYKYYAVPHDHHVTGRGWRECRRKVQAQLPRHASNAIVRFPTPLTLDIEPKEVNVCYEVDLHFESDASDAAYLLLDGREPLSLRSE